MSIDAVILGSAGYVGGELLRLLHAHPQIRIAAAVSATHADQPVGAVFPHLADACAGENFAAPDRWPEVIADGGKVALFSALPHATSASHVAAALETAAARNWDVHVVDSSADFRFAGAAEFAAVYGAEHAAPGLLGDFTCAVPEHATGTATRHAGHPGCFATAALLAAVPLMSAGLVQEDLFLSGITGSTGSGRDPKPGTHHPQRNSNLYAYNPLRHRHSPEIGNLLQKAVGHAARVHFVPHSGPFARGIHMTLQASLQRPASADEVRAAVSGFYADAPFVTVVDGAPRLKDVVASNRALIGIAVDEQAVTAMCVIDNLVKGAAGGALQWMNRLWSLPETCGLEAPAPGWT